MIELDGSDAGGQLVRNALALSVIRDLPFRLDNVRGGRSSPGLKPQHVTAIEVVKELTDADVEGLEEGSETIEFHPRSFDPHDISVNIGTAGSISLLFQSVMPLSFLADEAFSVTVEGGTDVKWSPPTLYLEEVAIPVLERFGAEIDVATGRHGFYPDGGGRARLDVDPSEPEEVFLEQPGELRKLHGVSIASQHLRDSNVAERQRSEARRILANEYPEIDLDIEYRYVQSRSPGSSIVLAGSFPDGRIGADALGEKGKRSEQVAKDAAEDLLEDIGSGAALDRYMADQVVPFLAQTGGAVFVPTVTDHLESAIDVTEQFLDVSFETREQEDCIELRCE